MYFHISPRPPPLHYHLQGWSCQWRPRFPFWPHCQVACCWPSPACRLPWERPEIITHRHKYVIDQTLESTQWACVQQSVEYSKHMHTRQALGLLMQACEYVFSKAHASLLGNKMALTPSLIHSIITTCKLSQLMRTEDLHEALMGNNIWGKLFSINTRFVPLVQSADCAPTGWEVWLVRNSNFWQFYDSQAFGCLVKAVFWLQVFCKTTECGLKHYTVTWLAVPV